MFRYCDGGSFLGTAGKVTANGQTLHFDGRAIVDVLFRHLQTTFKLGEATDVLISGLSAGEPCFLDVSLFFFPLVPSKGGLAALAHADSLRERLPSTARVKCASLAGIFPAWGRFSGFMKLVRELHKISGSLVATELIGAARLPLMVRKQGSGKL